MAQYLKAKNTQGRQMCSDGPAYFTCRIFDSQAIARVSMIFSVGCFNYIKYVIPRSPTLRPSAGSPPAVRQAAPGKGPPSGGGYRCSLAAWVFLLGSYGSRNRRPGLSTAADKAATERCRCEKGRLMPPFSVVCFPLQVEKRLPAGIPGHFARRRHTSRFLRALPAAAP